MVRIGTTPPASPKSERRTRRIVIPLAIGLVVVVAVTILVRASFDTDEPGAEKSNQTGRPPRTAIRDRPSGAGAPLTVVPLGSATEPVAAAPDPLTGAGIAAGVPPAAPPPPASADEARPTAAVVASAGAHPARSSSSAREASRGGAAGQSGATAGLGAGGAGGGRHADQKISLSGDAAKREAQWQRPPAGEESSSRFVARFAPTGGVTLRGRVIESDTGKPAVGIAVEAHIGDSYMRTITDAAGTFRMLGVLPGRRITVWIIGTSDTFVAERIEVSSPAEGETADAGVVRLLRGDELAAHLEGWMGMFVSRRGRRNVVAAVSPWSPADRAGIQVGDILMSIEGRDVDGLGPRATGFLLRGPVGTKAALSVQNHDGVVLRYQLERVLR